MTSDRPLGNRDLLPSHLRTEIDIEGTGVSKTRLKVLTLDDDNVDRMRLIRICEKSGMSFEYSEAENLSQLRSLLDQEPFDIVFLDHNLGRDSGLDALHMVISHEDQAGAIPIMVTGANDLKIAMDAMRNGCADYLVKEELTVASLTKSVATAVERRMLYAEISASKMVNREVAKVVQRFMLTCGPDIRDILKNSIKKTRGMKALIRNDQTLDPQILSDLTVLERGCLDLTTFVDDLDSVLHGLRASSRDPKH
ncbi:response regulator [Tritonibacter scottomollicae]|uniref:Response regulator receiver domain-containing protein n=1 Tax=Tritonibacter scottomollicae TaxID=483013 RepID=A0A2T1A2W1_TRISK|nr:response regulator [Tritonibacter scottomollicae]PRZ42949.1 response regulator receiver domain-containing protein [Tritonibacter scottomollicae]